MRCGKERGGLLPEQHGDLNRPCLIYPGGAEARTARIAELREKYSNDPKALQQIDVYDHNPNEYHHKNGQYRKALISNDTAMIEELETWFRQHYPDL